TLIVTLIQCRVPLFVRCPLVVAFPIKIGFITKAFRKETQKLSPGSRGSRQALISSNCARRAWLVNPFASFHFFHPFDRSLTFTTPTRSNPARTPKRTSPIYRPTLSH